MTKTEFEAALTADGFTEIETKTLPPRPANGEHGHHHDVRGLVLNGVFTVIRNDKPVHYHPGDTFFVANGDLHCEEIGQAGAEICVGKRY
jgi:quercetin dioxygenase-like cupin family protein